MRTRAEARCRCRQRTYCVGDDAFKSVRRSLDWQLQEEPWHSAGRSPRHVVLGATTMRAFPYNFDYHLRLRGRSRGRLVTLLIPLRKRDQSDDWANEQHIQARIVVGCHHGSVSICLRSIPGTVAGEFSGGGASGVSGLRYRHEVWQQDRQGNEPESSSSRVGADLGTGGDPPLLDRPSLELRPNLACARPRNKTQDLYRRKNLQAAHGPSDPGRSTVASTPIGRHDLCRADQRWSVERPEERDFFSEVIHRL